MTYITDDTALGGSFGDSGGSQVQSFNNAAAVSAEAAAVSEANAASSATEAATGATTSTSSAAAAASSESSSISAATSATSSATAAGTAKTDAETAEANASTSATSASTSATSSTGSATSAATSATSATSDALAAQASADSVGTSATDAAASATSAATSATSAGVSSTSASTSATTATTKASEASASATSATSSATTATTKASEASASATSATSSATAAETAEVNAETAEANAASSATSASASYDLFDDRFLGAKASAPTTDNDGNALAQGVLYFDTTAQLMKVYSTSGWKNAGSAVNGTSARFKYTATNNQTVFSGNDDDSSSLGYDPGFIDVYLSGLHLVNGVDYTATSGSSLTLSSGAATGDILVIVAYGTFSLATNVNADTLNTQPGSYYTGYTDTATSNVAASALLKSSNLSGLADAGTARGNLGLGTGDSPDFAALNVNGTATLGGLTVDGAGDVAFGTKLFWDASAESLGIGTSSPLNQLVISEGTGQHGIEFAAGTTSYIQAYDRATSDYGDLKIDAQTIAFGTGNGTERMRITSTGNVGVGTSAPKGKINSVLSQADTSSSSDTTLANSFLHMGGGEYGNGRYFLTTYGYSNSATNSGAYIGALGTSNTGFGKYDLVFGTRSATTDSAPTERMRIDSSGNVQVKGGNELRVYRGDNATYASIKYLSTSGGLQLNDQNGDGISFVQAGGDTEYGRFDASGNLLVGTASGSFSARITAESSSGYLFESRRAGTGNEGHVAFRNANGAVGTIFTNGTTTSYNTSSDQRLKENIADADDAGSKIDSIQVRKYDWKADGSHQDYGMIAQELLEVAPEAVSQGETEDDMMGVDYSKLVPVLIKEIQSLRNRVAQLEE